MTGIKIPKDTLPLPAWHVVDQTLVKLPVQELRIDLKNLSQRPPGDLVNLQTNMMVVFHLVRLVINSYYIQIDDTD